MSLRKGYVHVDVGILENYLIDGIILIIKPEKLRIREVK